MGYHPRIESAELASFLTTRSRGSLLWFVNNPRLEEAILGYTAKYSERYNVKLYALAIQGNHLQTPAQFPEENRSHFMRDLNSSIARAVPRFTPEYAHEGGGGRFWGRRYSQEFLPGQADIEHYFFYTVLQPVQDGLVEKISDYPGYNCFHDAVRGRARTYRVTRWGDYHKKKAYNPTATIDDFTDTVTLRFARLPGYEHLSRKDYMAYMYGELERRRQEIVRQRKEAGLGFLGRQALLKIRRGAKPYSTKTSTSTSHRPRVLSVCPIRRAECKRWYFDTYSRYKLASTAYRNGDLSADFPYGTYKPQLMHRCPRAGEAPPPTLH
jgi:hypothetical protein